MRFHVLTPSSLSLSNGIWYKWKFLSERTFVPEFRIHREPLYPRGRGHNFVPSEEKILIKSRLYPFTYLFGAGREARWGRVKSMTLEANTFETVRG